ncbi:hypothetical protein FA13DRAFT_1754899 [Coprinellus micaceus]|uniref:Ricin B lectin domain-containing protein n=1 Tax=Coprinellus micaceus TaxID=71717 RepID=A0A4Y7TAJ0_COPMI|nr:hypothetical protein FA13DRAFT_1754899 [Coprinellus micaceus]
MAFVKFIPGNNVNKCLDVRGAVFENGTPVQILRLQRDSGAGLVFELGRVRRLGLQGTNFCLDAGANPASGVGMKIWQCYDNLPAQQWYYTDDNRLAVGGSRYAFEAHVNAWICPMACLRTRTKCRPGNALDGNTNQVWTF